MSPRSQSRADSHTALTQGGCCECPQSLRESKASMNFPRVFPRTPTGFHRTGACCGRSRSPRLGAGRQVLTNGLTRLGTLWNGGTFLCSTRSARSTQEFPADRERIRHLGWENAPLDVRDPASSLSVEARVCQASSDCEECERRFGSSGVRCD